MHDNLVSTGEERFCRGVSKPVRGAGDEDTTLLVRV
jgi:hypothetical protein